jgi:hypothetical protein
VVFPTALKFVSCAVKAIDCIALNPLKFFLNLSSFVMEIREEKEVRYRIL